MVKNSGCQTIIVFFAFLLSVSVHCMGQLPDYIASEVKDADGNVVGFYDQEGCFHEFVIRVNPLEIPENLMTSQQPTAEPAPMETSPLPGALAAPKIVPLRAYDLVYEPFSRRIYASVSSGDPTYGNTIATINPETGVIEKSVFVGSEPRRMAASDDGEYIYIGLYGAGSVSRYHVPSGTLEATYSLGSGSYGTTYAEDLDVQPGNHDVIAVSRLRKGVSPRHDGVAIYVNGTKLPQQTSSHTGSNVIEFSDSPDILYGYCNESTGFAVYTNYVSENGISIAKSHSGLISGFGVDFEYDSGYMYTTSGRVIDTETMQLVGQFGTSGKVEPDASIRRTFFIDGSTLSAYHQKTFTLAGQLSVSGASGSPLNLIRWGERGLAYSTSNGQVVILETDLVVDPPRLTRLVIEGPEHVSTYKAEYRLLADFDDGVHLDVTRKARWSTDPAAYTEVNSAGTLAVFGTEAPGATQIIAEYSWAGATHRAVMEVTYEGTIPATGNLVRLEIVGPDQVGQATQTQYAAMAYFDDGTEYDVTENCIWTMEPSEIAGLDQGGLLTTAEVDRYRDVVLYAQFGHRYEELETVKTVLCTPDTPQTSTSTWPMYQANAKHDGYVPISLNPEEFSLRWEKQIVEGRSLNPVAAANGKVFVTIGIYFNNLDTLYALDARDAETLWSKNFGSVYSVNPPSYAYGNVYLQTGKESSSGVAPYLHCYNADSGEFIYRSIYGAQWERYQAPTIYDGSVYINGGYYGGMYGFDAFNGQQHWFRSLAQVDGWTPAVQGRYAYAFLRGTLTAVDRLYGTTAYTIQHSGTSYASRVPVIGSLNNILVTNNNSLVSFDLADQEIEYAIAGQFNYIPCVANNVIYVINGGSLEARNEADGQFLWSWTPPEGALANTMIATDSHIIACTQNNTYAVEILSRQQDWSYPASGHLALANDSIYIARSNGILTAIATPEYIPASPVSVEIEGPAEILEGTTQSYQARVTYSDGRVRERTALCTWKTDGTEHAFDQGQLSIGELLYPREKIYLEVEYTQEQVTVKDELEVSVTANLTVEELVVRNLHKTLGFKDQAFRQLTEALDIEYATLSVLKDAYDAAEPYPVNMAIRHSRAAILAEKEARQLIDSSTRELGEAISLFSGEEPILSMTNPDSPLYTEAVNQNADINTDGIVDLMDLAILSRAWMQQP